MTSSFPLKEPAWSDGNTSPPKAFEILRYLTPSDPPAQRVRAVVDSGLKLRRAPATFDTVSDADGGLSDRLGIE